MADPISGELVIVPDAEAIATITDGNNYSWGDAIAFTEAYSDGVNSDYRLPTKSEALAIFGNAELVGELTLDFSSGFWTIEEYDVDNAWRYSLPIENISHVDKVSTLEAALPIRKVNFYGLPLIDSEYGGGLVYDVVAATREVKIIPHWGDIVGNTLFMWDNAINYYPSLIGNETFTALPTRAEALKIFNNTYLCALAGIGLGVEYAYWTSEEYDIDNAYEYSENQAIEASSKLTEIYAIPVRSETV